MAFTGAAHAATYGGGFTLESPIHSEYTPLAGPTTGQKLKQGAMTFVFEAIKAVAVTGFTTGIVTLATVSGGMGAAAGAVIGAIAGAAWVASGFVHNIALKVLGAARYKTEGVLVLILMVRIALVIGAVIGAFVLAGQFLGVSLAIGAAIGFMAKAIGIGLAFMVLYRLIDQAQINMNSTRFRSAPTLAQRFNRFQEGTTARVSGIVPDHWIQRS